MAYEEYINSVFDEYYDTTSLLVKKMRDTKLINDMLYKKHANRIIDEKEYELRNELIIFIEKEIKELDIILSNLEIKNIKINKLFNLLYSLQMFNSKRINDFLEKYNYNSVFHKSVNYIDSKINDYNSKLDDIELDIIGSEICANKGKIDINKYFNYFVRKAILKDRNIDNYYFSEMIRQYIIVQIEKYYETGYCSIERKVEKTENGHHKIGSTSRNDITISKELIDDLYYNGKYDLLFTIFHELFHVAQYKNIFFGKLNNSYAIKELKDYVLSVCDRNYYDNNYNNISFEISARIAELEDTYNYLTNTLKFRVDYKYFEAEKNKLYENYNNMTRIYNGIEMSLDSAFEEFKYTNPEIFNKYVEQSVAIKNFDNMKKI